MKFRPLIAAIILAFFIPRPLASQAASWYTDVGDNYVYRDSIWYMTKTGAVSGYEDGTFLPENEINKVEALKVILKATGKNSSTGSTEAVADFSDLDTSAWYMDYVNSALANGIISGNPDGTFTPENTINRAELLKMLFEAADIEFQENDEEWYSKYLNYASENSIIWPDENGDYQPSANVSRGELCEIIYRLKKGSAFSGFEYGGATWYHGRSNDGSDSYETSMMTAAHLTLEFGTIVKVTNLKNNKSVIVKINDRGPYRDGYIIDLSSAAFEEIETLGTGIAQVYLEVLKK